MYYLALCYLYGDGVQKDTARATRKAHDKGHLNSTTQLASTLYYGTKKNKKEALRLWASAADRGCSTAHYELSLSSHPEKEIYHLQKAACNLGFKYMQMDPPSSQALHSSSRKKLHSRPLQPLPLPQRRRRRPTQGHAEGHPDVAQSSSTHTP